MESKTSSWPRSEVIQPSSATCRVERVLLQHDVELSRSVEHALLRDDPRLDLLPLVADEPALDLLVPERRDHPVVALHGLPGPLPLRQYLPRNLYRESVGVVQ